MTEMLQRRPEMAASLIREKTDLYQQLSQLALRKLMLTAMLTETETASDAAADRIGAINEFLGQRAEEGEPSWVNKSE